MNIATISFVAILNEPQLSLTLSMGQGLAGALSFGLSTKAVINFFDKSVKGGCVSVYLTFAGVTVSMAYFALYTYKTHPKLRAKLDPKSKGVEQENREDCIQEVELSNLQQSS